jgi:dihydrofolate reductase
MRKLISTTFLTLDGVMQAPGGPEEDPTDGFEHGGWSVPYWDEDMVSWAPIVFGDSFELVLGRKTYEIFAAHWPHTDEPGAEGFNRARKHVASRTLETLEWENSVLLGDDVPGALERLKAEDGPELQVHGSADLLQTLLAHGLMDELRIWTFPVVVGEGKRLFGGGAAPGAFELVDSRTSSTGVVLGIYRAAGPVSTGTFALEEPTEAERERRAGLPDA